MSEIETTLDEPKSSKKLFSSASIMTATFIGGPLGGSILIGQNFKAFGNLSAQRNSILLGLLFTAVLVGSAWILPDSIPEVVYRLGLPAISLGIVWLYFQRTQGELIEQHERTSGTFHPRWKGTSIGFLSGIVLGAGILGFALSDPDYELHSEYNMKMAEFTRNEEASLAFYDKLNYATDMELINEIDVVAIPGWKRNIEIINEVKTWEGLGEEIEAQNEILLEYSALRLEAAELIRKAIYESTQAYEVQLINLHNEIETVLNKL